MLVSCVSSCGVCRFCREGVSGPCRGGGGWLLGHTCLRRTQAEFVKVPFADTSTYHLPVSATDEEALLLGDTIPTGYEVGVLKAGYSLASRRGGDRALVRSGSPQSTGSEAIQPQSHCRDRSRRPRARSSQAVRGRHHREQLGNGPGQDCAGADRRDGSGRRDRGGRGGRDLRTGSSRSPGPVRRSPMLVSMASQPPCTWRSSGPGTSRSPRGLVDTNSIPVLLRLLASKQIETSKFVTHRFGCTSSPRPTTSFPGLARRARSRQYSARTQADRDGSRGRTARRAGRRRRGPPSPPGYRRRGRYGGGPRGAAGGIAIARAHGVPLLAVRAWALGLPRHGGRRLRHVVHKYVVSPSPGSSSDQPRTS